MINRGILGEVTVHRIWRSLGRLQNQQEARRVAGRIAPLMRQMGFEEQEIPGVEQVLFPVCQIFDLAFDAVHEFMAGVHHLTLAAAGVRFQGKQKRLDLLAF